jgi:hypothetical protein
VRGARAKATSTPPRPRALPHPRPQAITPPALHAAPRWSPQAQAEPGQTGDQHVVNLGELARRRHGEVDEGLFEGAHPVRFACVRAAALFDYLVGSQQQGRRNRQPERLGGLQLITNSNLVGCSTGRSWTCPAFVDTYPLREEGRSHAQDTSTVFH